MASDLRKGIVLGNDALNPSSIYSYWNQRYNLLNTNNRWVRFWADFSQLWPRADLPGFDAEPKWFDLDAQLRKAIADGLYVILTVYRCPTWANSARRLAAGVLDSDPYATFWVPDHTGMYVPGTSSRAPWSVFVEHLTIRYNPANPGNQGAWAHCIEVVNEPNAQLRPQAGVHTRTAELMKTARDAKAINGIQDFWPILLAPATSDTAELTPFRTPYNTFVSNLLNELNGWQAGGWYGWSHHNHRDIEIDGGVNSGWPNAINRAKATRDLLIGKWWGWGNPTNQNDPKVFLTEGGGRLDTIKQEWFVDRGILNPTPDQIRSKQAQLLQNNHNRMYTGSDGAGMSMIMQYLITSSWTYDTGLRDAYTYESELKIV